MESIIAKSKIALTISFPRNGFFLFIQEDGSFDELKKIDMSHLPMENPLLLSNKAIRLVFYNIKHIDFDELKGSSASLYCNLSWGLENYSDIWSESAITKIDEVATKYLNESLKANGPKQIDLFIGVFEKSTSKEFPIIFPDEPTTVFMEKVEQNDLSNNFKKVDDIQSSKQKGSTNETTKQKKTWWKIW